MFKGVVSFINLFLDWCNLKDSIKSKTQELLVLHGKNKLIPNYQHISLAISDNLNLTCQLVKKLSYEIRYSNFLIAVTISNARYVTKKNSIDRNKKPWYNSYSRRYGYDCKSGERV